MAGFLLFGLSERGDSPETAAGIDGLYRPALAIAAIRPLAMPIIRY